MSKLKAVVRHEYLTIVKQPSFWMLMLAIPLIAGAITAMNYFSNKASSDKINELADDLKTVRIVDESGLINTDVARQAGLQIGTIDSEEQYKNDVKDGQSQGLVVFPADLKQSKTYEIYVDSSNISVYGAVSSMADTILKTSLFLPLGDVEIIALAQDGASSSTVFYRDGRETAGFNEFIAPGVFLILFFIIITFSISYMLTSVSDEKENRSMEMVLTYVNPRTLIIGKLLGVTLATLTQIAFFGLVAVIGFIILKNTGNINLPFGIDLTKIPFDPVTLLISAGYLVAGFTLYAGLMITVAATAPSAKEANSFSSVFIISAIVPFYFISLLVTDPSNAVAIFLSYFPLTSPMADLVRNTVGNLDIGTALGALSILIASAATSIWLAVKAFRLGALEFAQTIKLSNLLK